MLHYLTNDDRDTKATLFQQMFRSRAEVFHEKLKWDVKVKGGLEFDHHDTDSDPLYLVLTDAAERVVGSLRLLPTTGDTMMQNEFAYMFDEPVDVRSPRIWECTRFCVPHGGDPAQHVEATRTSSDLLMHLCRFCLDNGIDQILGLYERPMTRIYRRIGWSPVPLATSRPEVGAILVGIWDATESALTNMRRLAGERPMGAVA